MLELFFSLRGCIGRLTFFFSYIILALASYLITLFFTVYSIPLVSWAIIVATPFLTFWACFALYLKRYRDIGVHWLLTTILYFVPWILGFFLQSLLVYTFIYNIGAIRAMRMENLSGNLPLLLLYGFVLYVFLFFIFIPLFWPGRSKALKYS